MINYLRRISQFAAVFITNSHWLGFSTKYIYTGPLKGFCVPVINCYACPAAVFACPIGVIQHFVGLHMIPFYMIGVLGLIGILFGQLACGWLCPFGLFQEMLFKLSKISWEIPRPLQHFKYMTLIFLVILLPYMTGEAWFSKLCPAGTLSAAIPWLIMDPINPVSGQNLGMGNTVGVLLFFKIAILALMVAAFVVVNRPFCKMFCPLGAIWELFNKVSILKMTFVPPCSSCKQCSPKCGAKVSELGQVTEVGCKTCVTCTDVTHAAAAPVLVNIKTKSEFG